VEPPDYLDEKEKAIFEMLKQALGPTALEVRVRAICWPAAHGCGLL
jgi:hypothetical protein